MYVPDNYDLGSLLDIKHHLPICTAIANRKVLLRILFSIAGGNLNRMNNVTVSLDAGTPVYTVNHHGDPQPYVVDIRLQPPRSAQEVTLARQNSPSTGVVPFMNICEVQVWGEQSLNVLLRIFI